MKDLWDSLLEQGVVSGSLPDTSDIQIPWYIRLLQGFAGWLAAIFLFGFFAVTFGLMFNKPTGELLTTLGILSSVGAYVLMKIQKNEFIDQFAMALSLSGQTLFAISLFFFMDVDSEVGFFILALYQLVLAWKIPHYGHRVLSTSFGLLSFLLFLNLIGLYGLGTALIAVIFAFIWLREPHWNKYRALLEPIGFGVALTIVFSSGFLVSGKHLIHKVSAENSNWLLQHAEFISSFLIGLIYIYLIIELLKENQVKWSSKTSKTTLIAAIGLILIGFKIPGLSVGIIILTIGFSRQRTTLMVLGGLSLISFFSWYYYNLNQTLLLKSVLLVVLGFSILIFWSFLGLIFKQKKSNGIQNLKLKSVKKNKFLAAFTVFIVLLTVNINIKEKQELVINGEIVIMALAPVDPRSLMQGDYMRLRFKMASIIFDNIRQTDSKIPIHKGHVIVEKDTNNLVTFVAVYKNQQLTNNQLIVPYQFRKYQVVFSTNAFYFQEGKANHFQKAKFGQFRISKDSEMILVNMLDEDFKVL